ncbi:MAG: phosphotransacetylase family protein [Chloroflexota bacterium]|nr:MAG: phosphotransacetylase family protein [Chloroflexota bacterium]
MVTALYIVSWEGSAGKTALCAGLSARLRGEGLKVSYLKPITTKATVVNDRPTDADAELMRSLLGLPATANALTPCVLGHDASAASVAGRAESCRQSISAALARAAADVVILEGPPNIADGAELDLSPATVAQTCDAGVIVIADYGSDSALDKIVSAAGLFGPRLIGAVVNQVPAYDFSYSSDSVRALLKGKNINVLGLLPQDPLLLTVSIREIASQVGGLILNADEFADELVENFMVGSMSLGPALDYFRRKNDKAVIVSSDRPDIQLVSLETSTRCLVVTGSGQPAPLALARADELGVPIISVRQDTLSVLNALEGVFRQTSFGYPRKIERFGELLSEYFDYAALYKRLNLKSKIA